MPRTVALKNGMRQVQFGFIGQINLLSMCLHLKVLGDIIRGNSFAV